MHSRVIGIKGQCFLEFLLSRYPVPVVVGQDVGPRSVGFSERTVEFEGLRHRLLGLGENIIRARIRVERQHAVVVCKARVGRRVARIFIQRLLEILPRPLQIFASIFVPVETPAQVGVVCLRINLGRTGKPCRFRCGQFDSHLVGNLSRHFALQRQNISEGMVVALSPHMLVRRRAN